MDRHYFSLKSFDAEKGEFEGLASVYDVQDLGGDIVKKGAFTRTLEHRKGKVPLLWQHDSAEVIGIAELKDSRDGLGIRGKLNLKVAKAVEAYELLKQGAIKGLSIGYDVVKETAEGGARLLKELALWEVSVVTFPMNPEAAVMSVKSPEVNNARIKADAEKHDAELDGAAPRDEKSGFDSALVSVIGYAEIHKEAKAGVDVRLVEQTVRSLSVLLPTPEAKSDSARKASDAAAEVTGLDEKEAVDILQRLVASMGKP